MFTAIGQELAYGGYPNLDKRITAKAKSYCNDYNHKSARMMKPLAGSKLIRIYKDVEHQVTVLSDGFEYKGQCFKSLTRIACDITGT